jgi:hypothetical protein
VLTALVASKYGVDVVCVAGHTHTTSFAVNIVA